MRTTERLTMADGPLPCLMSYVPVVVSMVLGDIPQEASENPAELQRLVIRFTITGSFRSHISVTLLTLAHISE